MRSRNNKQIFELSSMDLVLYIYSTRQLKCSYYQVLSDICLAVINIVLPFLDCSLIYTEKANEIGDLSFIKLY